MSIDSSLINSSDSTRTMREKYNPSAMNSLKSFLLRIARSAVFTILGITASTGIPRVFKVSRLFTDWFI